VLTKREGAEMGGLDDLVKGVSGGSGGGLGDILGGLLGSGGAGKSVDDIIGALSGGGGAGSGAGGGMGGLLGSLVPLVGGLLAGGGLQKVLGNLQANGLAAKAESWVGTGENQPLSAADAEKAVGPDDLKQIAAKLGVPEEKAAEALAQVLPTVIDKVSPDGKLPPEAELDSVFHALEARGGTPPAPQ
jgi:uncharacterized protein YidB (DUF937 family)